MRALASMPPDLRRSSIRALSPVVFKEARSGLRVKKSSEEEEGSCSLNLMAFIQAIKSERSVE